MTSYQPWQKGSGSTTDTTSKMNDILGNLQSSLNTLAENRSNMEKQITAPKFNPSPKTSFSTTQPFKFTKITAPTVHFSSDPKHSKNHSKNQLQKQDSNNFPPPPQETVEHRKSFQAPSFPAPPPQTNNEKFKINDIDDLLEDIEGMNLDSPLAGKKIGNAPSQNEIKIEASKSEPSKFEAPKFEALNSEAPTENIAPTEYLAPSFTKPKSEPKIDQNLDRPHPTGFNLYEKTPKRSEDEAKAEVDKAIENLTSGLNGIQDSQAIEKLVCFKCGLPIEKEAATVFGQNYHPECFTCTKCLKQLKTGVEFFVVGKNQPFCKECYECTLTTCFACGQKITQGRIVKALGNDYHPACFCCCECGINLDGKKFASEKDDSGNPIGNKKPYCVDCYAEKFAPKCRRCTKSIIGGDATISRIIVGKDEYCQGCFVCYSSVSGGCSKSLKDGAYPVKFDNGVQELFCHDCALEQQRASLRRM